MDTMRQWFTYLVFFVHISVASTIPTLPGYGAPRDPAGFTADLQFGFARLNPVVVHLMAIEAMANFCDDEWDSIVTGDGGAMNRRLGVGIMFMDMASGGSSAPLRLGHVLLGLYHGIVAMTERNKYQELTVGLEYYGQLVGIVRITDNLRSTISMHQSMNSSHTAIVGRSPRSLGIRDTGKVVDPNPRFGQLTIQWDLDGLTIPAPEVFTAILDAMISTATERPNAYRSYVYGVGSAADCVINVHSTSEGPSKAPMLTNEVLREGLLLIAKRVFFAERRFLEMEFTMAVGMHEIAKGTFFKLNRVSKIATPPEEKK
ncbi:hypothetical protein G7Y79_00018g045960 [Physcia stellaris]|nr:hypothetical protein G7Y79_00018g045960 [Physcia stellaris]